METIHEKSHDYKTIVLTSLIVPIGFVTGWYAHYKFDPLFLDSNASDNWILPARYSVGYASILPTYMMIAYLQKLHHGNNIPLWRRMTDFVISGFIVGCGVMFGRLFMSHDRHQ